jgi:hypothetical protein
VVWQSLTVFGKKVYMYHSTTQTLITNYLTWDDTDATLDVTANPATTDRFYSGSFSIVNTAVEPIIRHRLPKKPKRGAYFNLAGGW